MVHADTFAASSRSRGRTRWITLAGDLDLATAPRPRDELEHAATRAFADGVRIRGWRLRRLSPPPRVARIWRLTNTEMNVPVERAR